jgi:hypothetical protein
MLKRHGITVCLLCLGMVVQARGGDLCQKLLKNGAEVYYADLDLRAALAKTNRTALPEARRKRPAVTDRAFDWTKILRRDFVLYQAESETCWAFAPLTALEYNWVLRNGVKMPFLAMQPILDRTGKYGGNSPGLALQDLLEHGTCLASAYPHVGKPGKLRTKVPMRYRAIAWGQVIGRDGDPTVKELKQVLVEQGPLVAYVNATPAFQAYKGGVFREDTPPRKTTTGHAVVLVGWDETKGKAGCWRIENSWSEKWGEHGFMWLEYGSNDIGRGVWWLRTQSTQYQLPDDIHKRVSADAAAFPKWTGARKVTAKPPDLPVLTAAEALAKQGERVVVQFRVRAIGFSSGGEHMVLLSEKSLDNEQNLMVSIGKSELAKFPAKSDRELLNLYNGKEIRVRGAVQPKRLTVGNRSMIEVSDPEQIEIVK